ncbi:hypothetical protein HER10_EVM0009609 [Colletotrichum scovillei]|uniref:Integral membrane protein n=1 Tax=Colletotrichum scovillei TaxID=1209932 RepID=A0A9P7U358_9PEZI|nr:uncharacterized protein HER10_EVM0009609 [Colletotrichum scovillei]KAF4784547.1 hypothetical protein HER10_EVM0009609 [Colletotrichum scovillei]KAG7038005.1 integral membrane protein [Colletotrichum scovillei]KAG7040346.1 integral membrane protein [Colletotrichum scovillei]KAG7060395.1 integral membrane protein [Colletotrichum scovillei]
MMMKFMLLRTGILAALALVAGAESIFDTNATAVAQWLGAVPQCSLSCFAEVLSSGSCQLKGLAKCACTNDDIQLRVSTCVQLSCDFADQVDATRKSQVLCHDYPNQQRKGSYAIFAITLPVITTFIVFLRCFARWTVARKLWWDDYVTLLALGLLIVLSACGVAICSLGFGKHYWVIDPNNAKPILQMFYAMQIIYVLVTITAKITICCFYHRVFPSKRSQIAAKAAIVVLIIRGLVVVFLIAFQCVPLTAIWDKSAKGQCLNLTAIGYAGAISGIVEDVVLLIMPIPELLHLQLGLKKKLGLIFMFCLGSFGCIASVVRLKYLVSFANSFDPTWDNADVVSWSGVEVNVAVVCGSLAALRALFNYLVPYFTTVKEETSESMYSLREERKEGAIPV